MKLKIALLFAALLLAGCHSERIYWHEGHYGLVGDGDPIHISLAYDAGTRDWRYRIEPTIFAVGQNSHYVVAKQHPNGHKPITRYFVIDVTKDSAKAKSEDVVAGPLTEDEFKKKAAQLGLPEFTQILHTLE